MSASARGAAGAADASDLEAPLLLVMPRSGFEDVAGERLFPEATELQQHPQDGEGVADRTRFEYCLQQALKDIKVKVLPRGGETNVDGTKARLRLTLALPQDNEHTSFLAKHCLWVRRVDRLGNDSTNACSKIKEVFSKEDWKGWKSTVVIECEIDEAGPFKILLLNSRVLSIRKDSGDGGFVDLSGDCCRAFPIWTTESEKQHNLVENCKITLYPLPSALGVRQWMRLESLVVDRPYLDLLHEKFRALCAIENGTQDFANRPNRPSNWMNVLKILDADITHFHINSTISPLTALCNHLLTHRGEISHDSVMAVRALLFHGADATAAKARLSQTRQTSELKGHAMELRALLRAFPDEPWSDLFRVCKVSYSTHNEAESVALEKEKKLFNHKCIIFSCWPSFAAGSVFVAAVCAASTRYILFSSSSLSDCYANLAIVVFIVMGAAVLFGYTQYTRLRKLWLEWWTWLTPNHASSTPWRRLVPEAFVDKSICEIADKIEKDKNSAARYANVEFQPYALIGCVGPAVQWAQRGAFMTWMFFFVFTLFAYHSLDNTACPSEHGDNAVSGNIKDNFGKKVSVHVQGFGFVGLLVLLAIEYKVLTYVLVPVLQVSQGFKIFGKTVPFGLWLLYTGAVSMATKLDLVTTAIFVAQVWAYKDCYVIRNVQCLSGAWKDAGTESAAHGSLTSLVTVFWVAMFAQGGYSLIYSFPVRGFRMLQVPRGAFISYLFVVALFTLYLVEKHPPITVLASACGLLVSCLGYYTDSRRTECPLMVKNTVAVVLIFCIILEVYIVFGMVFSEDFHNQWYVTWPILAIASLHLFYLHEEWRPPVLWTHVDVGACIFRILLPIIQWRSPDLDWLGSEWTSPNVEGCLARAVLFLPGTSPLQYDEHLYAREDDKALVKSPYYCMSKDHPMLQTKDKDCVMQIHKELWTVTPEQIDPGNSIYIAPAVLIHLKLDDGSTTMLSAMTKQPMELQLRGLYNNKCMYFHQLEGFWIYFDDDGAWKFVQLDPPPGDLNIFGSFLSSYKGPVFVPHVSPDSDSLVPPAGFWDHQSLDQSNGCRIELIRSDNPEEPPKMWTKRDWGTNDKLACYVCSPAVQYKDATEDSVLSPHEGGTPEGRYHTLLDESDIQWSGYADSVLLLADFNRMASVVSMKTAYNKGKLEYYLSRGNWNKAGPAFGVLQRVIKLTCHKTLLYGVAQSFFILNFQMMIYNMLRLVRGSADFFSLAMVIFGVSTYLRTCNETFQIKMWVSECLDRPPNKNGFKAEEVDELNFKRQLRQSKRWLELSLACYFVFGLMLIWKGLQSIACPEHTVGGMSFGFASCIPVNKCCRTTCLDQHFLQGCNNTNDHKLFEYMNQLDNCVK